MFALKSLITRAEAITHIPWPAGKSPAKDLREGAAVVLESLKEAFPGDGVTRERMESFKRQVRDLEKRARNLRLLKQGREMRDLIRAAMSGT